MTWKVSYSPHNILYLLCKRKLWKMSELREKSVEARKAMTGGTHMYRDIALHCASPHPPKDGSWRRNVALALTRSSQRVPMPRDTFGSIKGQVGLFVEIADENPLDSLDFDFFIKTYKPLVLSSCSSSTKQLLWNTSSLIANCLALTFDVIKFTLASLGNVLKQDSSRYSKFQYSAFFVAIDRKLCTVVGP